MYSIASHGKKKPETIRASSGRAIRHPKVAIRLQLRLIPAAADGAGDASPPAQQLLRTAAASATMGPQDRNAGNGDGFPCG